MQRILKLIAPFIPYLTVGIGLLILKNVWIAILGYHLGIQLVIMATDKKVPFKLFLNTHNRRIALIAAVLGLCGGLSLYLFWPYLGISSGINEYFGDIGLDKTGWPVFIAYFCLVNPWLEEYYWRGYLAGQSRKLEINDILFSGYHVLVLFGLVNHIWVTAVFVVLVLVAWLWRQINRINHGLLTSVVSHWCADISVITVIYIMTRLI